MVKDGSDSRVAFLGVYQVRNFKVQGKVRLIICGIACIIYCDR